VLLCRATADDSQGHLSATTRLLNSLPDFEFFSGGLREATAWLCLRQDIYISLVTQQPLRTNLIKFLCSGVFAENNEDDFAWANRMVFLLARLLACAFCGGEAPSNNNSRNNATADIWSELEEEIEQWQLKRPVSFDPIRFTPRSQEEEYRLPQIWMLSAVHGKLPLLISHCEEWTMPSTYFCLFSFPPQSDCYNS